MTLTGRCFCGGITFSAEGKVNWVANCHCESCRRATSSPMTTWISVPLEGFHMAGDTPARHSSSPGVTRMFCPTCGSPLSYENTIYPGEIHLYVASLSNPEAFAPGAHVYDGERIPWFDTVDNLPRYHGTGSGGAGPVRFGPSKDLQ